MVSPLMLLLLLPVVSQCSIEIDIQAAKSKEDARVYFGGAVVDIISDTERNTFQLNDYQLKNAVDKFVGGRPDDVFVKSPTRWGDLYTKYNWKQVQRKLQPISAKIIGLHTKPVIVTTKFFDNRKYSGNSTFRGSIAQSKRNTLTTTWSKTYGLSLDQKIKIGVNILIAKFESTTGFTVTASWGEETSKSESTTLGSESGIEIELAGGQAAVAVLSATRGTMDVEVEYEATLSGTVAVNFSGRFQGHYFWAYDVNAVLEAAGLPTSIKSTQTIRVGFYSDSSVTHHDYVSGEPLPISKK